VSPIFFKLISSLIFSHFVHPYALLQPRASSLGIKFIAFDATVGDQTVQYAFFGGIVEYEKDVFELFPQDTEQYIGGLCKKALKEAQERKEEIDAEGRQRALTGMDAFVVGKEIYFASPLGAIWKRGQNAPDFFYGIMPKDEPLRQQLLQCQTDLVTQRRHRVRGDCGEIVNMQVSLLP
jgi:hypothetical protein